MNYSRVTPRARSGTSGISEEYNLKVNEGCWISPPDRIAAVTVAVHIPEGAEAKYRVQACCNRVDTIGQDGNGGYWDDYDETNPVNTKSEIFMLANAVTGIRVLCEEITDGYELNVCFVG